MNKIKYLFAFVFLMFGFSIGAMIIVNPDNPDIHIKGSNYIKMKEGEMIIHRHSDKVYEGTTKSNLFDPVKARTSTGIYIEFKTKSPVTIANFKIAKGLKKGGVFTVFKDGKFYKNYAFKYKENTRFAIKMEENQNKETIYRITFPLKTDIHFLGLELEKGFGLIDFKDEKKGVYLAFGDSITHGTGQKSTDQTYAYQLAEKLNYDLYNIAVGGAKTSQVMAEMVRDDFAKIDLITVLIGFNDYNGEGITVQEYKKRYTKVLNTIRETHPETKIYCITLLTTKANHSKTSGIAAGDFRRAVRSIVAERQEQGDNNIFLINGEKITSVEDLKDQVHLNQKGAKRFANALYDIIENKGKNIVLYNRFDEMLADKKEGKITTVDGLKGEKTTFKFETLEQPEFIYQLAMAIPVKKQNFEKGRVFLLSFEAKTLTSEFETGEAKVLFLFRQSDSHSDNIEATLSLSPEWSRYYVPFQSTEDISRKFFKLVMQYGFRPQSFLIRDIKFEVFPQGTKIDDLPKTKITYVGMENDAKWRKEAEKRIEKIRKSDFTLVFTKEGKPLTDKKIKIELIKHQFGFGAALNADGIVNNSLEYEKFKEGFNLVVLENDLKIKRWKNKKRRETTLKALKVLKNDGIDIKGHVLVWPGLRYLTKEVDKYKDNPKRVTNYINNHLKNILKETKGYVSHWDVVNEAYTNKDLQKITGSEKILYNAFRIVKRVSPNVERYTNEYGIISKGGIDKNKQQWYFDFIKRIDKHTGGLVDGIGIQSHMGSDLTPPEKVLEILDFYAKLNKKISISEFTMTIKDDELRERYTRDFMIAAFSHPNVSEFLFWGCMRDSKNTVDIFTENGEPGSMGKAFFSLVHDKWKTVLTAKTDAKGEISANGFYGIYKYSFISDGKEIKGNFDFSDKNNNLIYIEL